MYKYVFRHKLTKAKLTFENRSIEEAIQLLAIMVSTVADWDMKRHKHT